MSIEKNMNARIQHKHDIEANWNKALNFIPKIGEIIIYDIDENHNYERIKIGDGITTVNNLDFLLDSKYISSDKADAVKKASGEIVSLTNSVHTPLYGFKLYGKTTQNGTPSPEAPVELVSAGDDGSVDVSVVGKNLIDYKTAIPRNDTQTVTVDESINGVHWYGDYYFYIPVNIPKGVNVRFSCKSSGEDTIDSFNVVYEDGTTDYNVLQYPILTQKNVIRIQPRKTNTGTRNNVTVWDMQLELGTTATDYEPYKAPQTLTVSTPNGLAGIPVTSGGNYTDNNGQQWICDEVDFARGVYVQRINTRELTGNEEWWTYSNSGYNVVNSFRFRISDSMENDMNDKESCPVYSNYFERGGYVGKNFPTCIGVSEGKFVYFRFDGENDTITTIQQLNDWLASKKAEGNSVIVNYILATPIETPLSAEQLEAYASLHTNEPNTSILNDGNAGMEVKYYTPSTAVQMVHSPLDEGKILSIDEHGCVVLSELAIDGYATEAYVDEKVASLVDTAPEALNTLNELAAALGDDENFATTVTNQIAAKQDAITGVAGQFVVIGEDGNPTTRTIPYAEEASF